jgi:hypothetical protein
MKKQTAVEFLIKEFSDIIGPLDTKPMQDLLMMDAMKMAKAMEKEHNEYFFNCGRNYQLTGEGTFTETYNETYGK